MRCKCVWCVKVLVCDGVMSDVGCLMYEVQMCVVCKGVGL